jgi:hypothetical protein
MRWIAALIAPIFLLPIPGLALSDVSIDDLAHHPISLDFPSGGQLDLHIRSGEIHIVGGDENKVVVTVTGKRGSDSTDIAARFTGSGSFGKLRIQGGPNNEVTITIQVPRNSDLAVRVAAGDLEVKDITGNKNVDLTAGNLTIGVGNPAEYAHVDASVTTGSILANPFGESRGGLFRSFEKFGGGKYKLVAHVGAGDLTLK